MSAPKPDATSPLAFTGERFVPGVRGEIWLEHWHRYLFAARLAKGGCVADVACGEGYGSALLARHARKVTGIDVSAEAVAHARACYAGTPGLSFEQSSCTALPLADSSVDLFVSFETIEHIHEQEAFLAEIARVLTPDGVLLLSCPNKEEYTDRRNYQNEFHVRELYRDELSTLVTQRFPHVRWLGHRLSFYSVIAPESPDAAGEFFEATESDPSHPGASMAAPLYYVLLASRSGQALERGASVSALGDRDHQLYADYFEVTRAYRTELARREALERDAAAHMSELAACRAQLAQRDAHLRKLAGLRGWLRRPLVRLGLLRD